MPDKMQLLKQKISAANLTVDELAIQIGMNPSTFYRKTKNGLDAFTVGEMHSLVDALKLWQRGKRYFFKLVLALLRVLQCVHTGHDSKGGETNERK